MSPGSMTTSWSRSAWSYTSTVHGDVTFPCDHQSIEWKGETGQGRSVSYLTCAMLTIRLTLDACIAVRYPSKIEQPTNKSSSDSRVSSNSINVGQKSCALGVLPDSIKICLFYVHTNPVLDFQSKPILPNVLNRTKLDRRKYQLFAFSGEGSSPSAPKVFE